MKNLFNPATGIPVQPFNMPLKNTIEMSNVDDGTVDRQATIKTVADMKNFIPEGDPFLAFEENLERNRQMFGLVKEQEELNNSRIQRMRDVATDINSIDFESSDQTIAALEQHLAKEQAEAYPTEASAAENLEDLMFLSGEEVDPNRLDRWENQNLDGGWQTSVEFTRRKLAIAKAVEEVVAEKEDRAGAFALLDLGFFFLPLIDSTARTGNVPGVDTKWWEHFFAGTAQRRENAQLFSMNLSPEEFDETMAQVKLNMKNSSTDFFGTYRNFTQEVMLLQELTDTPSAELTNTWNALDNVGLVFGGLRAGKATVNTLKLMRYGGNSEEGISLLTKVLKTFDEEGAAGLKEKYNVDLDDLVDEVTPSGLSTDDALDSSTNLSLIALERNEKGLELVEELKLISKDLSRMNPEEAEELVAATVKKFAKDTGYKAQDIRFEVVNKTAGTGIESPVLKVFLGTKKGGEFVNESGVRRLAKSLGFGNNPTIRAAANLPRKLLDNLTGGPKLKGPDQDDFIVSATKELGQRDAGNVVIDANKSQLDRLHGDAQGRKVAARRNSKGQFATDKDVKVLVTPDGNIIAGVSDSFEDLAKTVGLPLEDLGKGRYHPDKTNLNGYLNLDNPRASVKTFEGETGKKFKLADEAEDAEAEAIEEGVRASAKKDLNKNGYLLEIELPLNEVGIFTPVTDVKAWSGIGRKLLGGRKLSSEEMFGLAELSTAVRNKIVTHVKKYLAPKFQVLSPIERKFLDRLYMVGDQKGAWLSDTEIRIAYEVEFPNSKYSYKRIKEAYDAIVSINDMEYALRNAEMYSRLNAQGYSTVAFKLPDATGKDVLANAKVHRSIPEHLPEGRIYNASEDIHYLRDGSVGDVPMSPKTLQDEGYVLLSTETPIKAPNGAAVNSIVIKADELEIKPLEQMQLNYRPGGHRIYSPNVRYFVKQAAWHVQPDTGKRSLENPRTFIGARNATEGEEWVSVMEGVRAQVNRYFDGSITTKSGLKRVLTKHLDGRAGFPSASDIVDDLTEFETGGDFVYRWDTPFEVVYDRELPTLYSAGRYSTAGVSDMSGSMSHMQTLGRMYYSPKGSSVKLDYRGEKLPVLNVYEMLGRSFSNVSNLIGMSAYRDRLINKWFETYKDILKQDAGDSPMKLFQDMPFREGVDPQLIAAAKQQREVGMRVLNWNSPEDNFYKSATRSLYDMLDRQRGGPVKNAFRKSGTKVLNWWEQSNAVGALRGLAFDAKLGLFNPRQMWLQMQTMFVTMSVNPKRGAPAALSAIPLRFYSSSKWSRESFKAFAEKGAAKAFGFNDVDEFMAMADELKEGGFLDIKNTHILINNTSSESLYNLSGNSVRAFRETGRTMFYEAERMNRTTAFSAAWQEARATNPNLKGQAFLEKVYAKASDYSVNMTEASAAAWQKGWASMPTQFWPYQFRLLELMAGEQLTTAQKMGLMAGQMTLYGSAGIPLLAFISDQINKKNAKSPSFSEEPAAAFFDKGLLDGFVYLATGAETDIASAAGTGGFWTDTIASFFNAGQYGETPPIEVITGASGGIWGDAIVDLYRVAKWSSIEGGFTGPMTTDAVNGVFRNVSSYNNGFKAYMAHRHGVLTSTKGSFTFDVSEEENAELMALLGVPTQKEADLSAMMQNIIAREELKKDFVKLLTNYRTAAENNWGDADKLIAQINVVLQYAPPEMRQELIEEMYKYPSEPLYDSVKRNIDKKMQEKKLNRQFDEQTKKENN